MIDKLKKRIQQLISAYETERECRKRLEVELEKSENQNESYRKQIIELERTIDNLKLADAFKSGGTDNTEARKKIDKLIKEIGDVAWYIAEIATALGVTLEDVLTRNIEKLKARYPDGFKYSDSLNRTE